MCLLCTAIPMTMSLGARAHVKWIEKRDLAQMQGAPVPEFISVPLVVRATSVATIGLVVGAVVYHSLAGPHMTT